MNSKHLTNVILVACLAALAVWRFWPVTPTPLAAVGVTVPAFIADPQANPSTTIGVMIRLLQAGDTTTLLQKYFSPRYYAEKSPEEKAMIEAEVRSPEEQKKIPRAIQVAKALQFTTPVYNADKTQATYTPADGGDGLVLVKINGRWYVQ